MICQHQVVGGCPIFWAWLVLVVANKSRARKAINRSVYCISSPPAHLPSICGSKIKIHFGVLGILDQDPWSKMPNTPPFLWVGWSKMDEQLRGIVQHYRNTRPIKGPLVPLEPATGRQNKSNCHHFKARSPRGSKATAAKLNLPRRFCLFRDCN